MFYKVVMYSLFFGFLVCFFVFVSYICLNGGWVISVLDLLANGSYWGVMLNFDIVSFGVLLMLSVCFGYAVFYTGHYFGGDLSGIQLNKIICLFVGVMGSLTITGDFLTTLIFWEYLGVVSFFLILFYLNFLSLRASVVTLVSSRFGDVSLFFLIAITGFTGYYGFCVGLLILLIVFSKSASFPFISWLLEAMRAPTPVSSLVHSSTLVAAGVWFSMRYDVFIMFNGLFWVTLLLFLTIIITGLCCFFFMDLKKIVALSTCNNIAWCVLYLVYGDVVLALFQLMSHGVSKCLLFMLVGDVMSGSAGSQASNCVYSSRLYGNWGIFGLFSVVLGLSGAPFIGVFFTKHFLLSTFNSSSNIVIIIVLLLSVFLSYFYSFRLCSILTNVNISLTSGVLFTFNSGLMVYFWLFVNYLISGYLEEVNSVNSYTSMCLLVFQIVSIITAYFLYNSVIFSGWSSSLFGCDNLVETLFNTYLNSSNFVNIFFYRWDKESLCLLSGQGISAIKIFNNQMLNILLLSVLFFLFCYVVLL